MCVHSLTEFMSNFSLCQLIRFADKVSVQTMKYFPKLASRRWKWREENSSRTVPRIELVAREASQTLKYFISYRGKELF